MGIFKKANNIYITVRDTYTSISGSSYEEAEEVIIEATNGDLELISQKKVIMQGLGKEDEEQEIEQSEPNNSDNEPNFFINFRLPKDYKGDFGFDWMRREYLPNANNGGKGLCIPSYEGDTDYINRLEKEYHSAEKGVNNTLSVNGKKYYTSFLNIIPNKSVELQLEYSGLESLPKDYDPVISFETKEQIDISPKQILLSEVSATKVTITCLSPLTEHTQIKIRTELGKEVGNMMVMKNDVRYKLNVQFVEVEFRGKIIYDSSKISKGKEDEEIKQCYCMTHDFDAIYNDETKTKGCNSFRFMEGTSLNEIPLNLSVTIEKWKNYIENNKLFFRNTLNQALIEYTPCEKKGNINYQKIVINFGKFEINKKLINKIEEDRIKNSILYIHRIGIICDLTEFLIGLRECYEKKYKKERGITVFLIPIQLSFPIERNAKKEIIFDGRGFACTDSSFKEGHYIMLNDVKDVPRDTLIHEAGHSLGLFHSFQIKGTNEEGKEVIPSHTFEKEKTDNIMDYSNNNRIFWKWQWLKMQKDLEDLEQI